MQYLSTNSTIGAAVQDRWHAGGCAHPGHVRSLSPARGNAVIQTFEILGTDRGWSPKLVIFLFLRADTTRRKTGEAEHEHSRLKTMPMDGATATTATRQALTQPELCRILVALPPSRHLSAGGYGAEARKPLWSFGGQSRKPANVGSSYKNANDGSEPSLCAAPRKADVSTKSWSELAPLLQGHCEHCNNLLPSVLLHGHASPTPS